MKAEDSVAGGHSLMGEHSVDGHSVGGHSVGGHSADRQSPRREQSLVILPPGLGWLLRSLPLLDALHRSGRQALTVNAEAAFVPLLQLCGLDPRPRSWHELGADGLTSPLRRPTPFSEAFMLSDRLADAWWARRQGIAQRWGYRGGWRSFLLEPAIRRPEERDLPIGESFRELLAAAGAQLPVPAAPRLHPTAELIEKGRRRLERANLPIDGTPLIGLYAGTQGGESGRPWPRQDFIEVLQQLRRAHPGWRFVLLATVRDLWTSVRLFEDTGKIHPVIGPDLDYVGLVGVMHHLSAVIAADSWPLQLAAACALPTLGLFARQRAAWAPIGCAQQSVVAEGSSLAPIQVDEVVASFEPIATLVGDSNG